MPHWQRQDIRACVSARPAANPRTDSKRAGEPVLYKALLQCLRLRRNWPRHWRGLVSRRLVVVGLYTHGCVRATVLDAYARGFEVLVADDAIGSTEPLHAELSRDWLNGRAACFLPSAELLASDVDSARAEAPHRRRSGSPTPAQLRGRGRSPLGLGRTRRACRPAGALGASTRARRRRFEPAAGAGDRQARRRGTRRAAPHTGAYPPCRQTRAREALEEAPTAGVRVCYRPLGTVALITPWNNPLAIPAGKLAPALAFGNGCVWKPSPRAPRCALALHRALLGAGLPPGLVQLVAGAAETARDIITDPRIDAVALTGSNTAGRAISALCAARQKPLQAELGGNNAALILDDWDFDEADLAQLAQAAFGFAGQRCTALRRLIVQRGVLARFTDAFAAQCAPCRSVIRWTRPPASDH
jgi:hypothetical protein